MLKIQKRFTANYKIDKFTGCWEWTAFKNEQGYGKFKAINQQLAHRVSWILHIGYLDPKSCVLHKCDNTSCVNPQHFFEGDRDANNKDRAAKGRSVTPNMNLTHCKRGHEFNEENTIIRKAGTRLCRLCNNAGSLRRHHLRKQNV